MPPCDATRFSMFAMAAPSDMRFFDVEATAQGNVLGIPHASQQACRSYDPGSLYHHTITFTAPSHIPLHMHAYAPPVTDPSKIIEIV